MNSQNIERSVDVNFAIDSAYKKIKELGLKISIDKKSYQNLDTISIKSVFRNELIQGNGKGLGMQCLASALFEFLEHYVYNFSDFYSKSELVGDLEEIKNIFGEELVFKLFLKYHSYDKRIKATKLLELGNEDKYIMYPSFLLNTTQAKSIYHTLDCLIKYCSNNGVAVGINANEAILHSLLELIERESVSRHLIDVFFNGKDILSICISTLPPHLSEIYDKIRILAKKEIKIIQLGHLFDVYSYMVFFKAETGYIHKGFGASICSTYALERALLECLQSIHLCDDESVIEFLYADLAFQEYPKYSEIMNLNYDVKRIKKVKFTETYSVAVDVETMLNKLILNIKDEGYSIFYNKKESENFCYVHCLIPNFERIHLILDGLLVVPNNL